MEVSGEGSDPSRRLIVILRLATAVLTIAGVSVLWRVMASLPWQLDVLLAAFASLAWAYRFERETS